MLLPLDAIEAIEGDRSSSLSWSFPDDELLLVETSAIANNKHHFQSQNVTKNRTSSLAKPKRLNRNRVLLNTSGKLSLFEKMLKFHCAVINKNILNKVCVRVCREILIYLFGRFFCHSLDSIAFYGLEKTARIKGVWYDYNTTVCGLSKWKKIRRERTQMHVEANDCQL